MRAKSTDTESPLRSSVLGAGNSSQIAPDCGDTSCTLLGVGSAGGLSFLTALIDPPGPTRQRLLSRLPVSILAPARALLQLLLQRQSCCACAHCRMLWRASGPVSFGHSFHSVWRFLHVPFGLTSLLFLLLPLSGRSPSGSGKTPGCVHRGCL